MKTTFNAGNYTAKYNPSVSMWDVYKNNYKVAVIYDDSNAVRFTDTNTSHDLLELTYIIDLTREVNRQAEEMEEDETEEEHEPKQRTAGWIGDMEGWKELEAIFSDNGYIINHDISNEPSFCKSDSMQEDEDFVKYNELPEELKKALDAFAERHNLN